MNPPSALPMEKPTLRTTWLTLIALAVSGAGVDQVTLSIRNARFNTMSEPFRQ